MKHGTLKFGAVVCRAITGMLVITFGIVPLPHAVSVITSIPVMARHTTAPNFNVPCFIVVLMLKWAQ